MNGMEAVVVLTIAIAVLSGLFKNIDYSEDHTPRMYSPVKDSAAKKHTGYWF